MEVIIWNLNADITSTEKNSEITEITELSF